MNWDINGQPLTPGHCEVHPGIPESWPCSVCRAEDLTTPQATPSLRVSIEDAGPILEAILAPKFINWSLLHAGTKAQLKQEMLDLILPGLTVFIDQVNGQLAEQEQSR